MNNPGGKVTGCGFVVDPATDDQNRNLMFQAYKVGATYGTDPSTQNGAVLIDPMLGFDRIVAVGANCFPTHIKPLPQRWERPIKYSFVEHAERNAIYAAARLGIRTQGLHMYCYWASCADCARAIIQAGITRLVTHKYAMEVESDRWRDSIMLAHKMLEEAGVSYYELDCPIEDISIRFHGKIWTPNKRWS